MITIDDLYRMLSKGKTESDIRYELIQSASRDIWEAYSGEGKLNFRMMSAILKQNGYDLEQLPNRTFWDRGKIWYIKLSNTTITIMKGKGYGTSIKYFDESGAHSWDIRYLEPEKFMDSIREADEKYPEIISTWESFEKEIRKFQKIREISENSIDAIVREKLRGTGIKYNLTLEPTDVLLKVKMKRGRYFEIKLPHNGFSDILTGDFVEEINKVATLLNGIKYTCKIQRYGNNINWFKSE